MTIYTGDPDRDAAVHLAQCDAEAKRLPQCDKCDYPIEDEYYFEDEDGIFCENCWHNVVRDKYMKYR